jgi:hypothetical protein
MATDLWSAAIEEAMNSAPPDQVILPTLELRHPLFINENGVYEPVRIVNDPGFDVGRDDGAFGHFLNLEDGSNHLFLATAFGFVLPEQTLGQLPEVEVSIDNVGNLLIDDLNAAITIRADIEMTYREYIFGIPEPQFVLNGLILKRVKTTPTRTTGAASFADLMGTSFPSKLYRPAEYKSLSA